MVAPPGSAGVAGALVTPLGVGELLALLNADKLVKRTVSGSHPYRMSQQAVTKVTWGNIAVNIKTI